MKRILSIFLRLVLVFIIFVAGYSLFCIVYLIFEPQIYESRKELVEKTILLNENVSEVKMLGNPDESTFVLNIKMKDDIELILGIGTEYETFNYIFSIGGFRPLEVFYDIEAGKIRSRTLFSIIEKYPMEKNLLYHEVLKRRNIQFLLENYKAVFLEIEGLPLLDDETSQWLNGHNTDMPDSAVILLGSDTCKGSVFMKKRKSE